MTDVSPAIQSRFPMKRSCPMAPPPDYEQLRAEGTIVQVVDRAGKTAWLTTSHEHARTLLADPRSSKNGLRPGFPQLLVGQAHLSGETKGFLVWMDPPEHSLYRHMLAGEFTLRRIQKLAPRIQAVVDECLDQILESGPPVDLVHDFALPVSSQMICELLGVPYAERDLFETATSEILSHAISPEGLAAAFRTVRDLMGRLIDAKSKTPEDDLLSRLIARYREAGVYDHDHLVGMAVMLLGAGHETTANMIALGTLTLLQRQDVLAGLRADPALAPQVVEELLRYLSIADQVTCRVATEDIELGGTVIRAGEGIIAPNAAANHDPAVFDKPGELDIHRNARPHLAFGYGIHQCLGQHMSRLELEIVFKTLFDRIPGLRLAVPAEQLAFKDEAVFFGVREMPVTWESGPG